jgi:L-iduronidase
MPTFATEPARYDYARLDAGLDLLLRNDQIPIFEIMGNPNGQFTDFHDPLQLANWRVMVRDLLLHLIERYGLEAVQRWYFESWNEPDVGWWPQWPHDTAAYNNYYDACAAGVEDAEAAAGAHLVFGGAGTCRTLSQLFQDFVAHAGYRVQLPNRPACARRFYLRA